jgi:signal peptide peptidase SppA
VKRQPHYAWHDSLLWSIRPDCHQDARAVIARIADANSGALTPDAAGGLHRDSLWKNITSDYAKWFDLDMLPLDIVEGGIGIVSVIGPLVNLVNPWTANYPLLTAAFDKCRNSMDIKTVVVRFNTPGGTVSGLHECAKALDLLSNEKLTVAQNDGGCYSAGYYLATRCGTICSGPTDQLGNIGTVTALYDYSKYFEAEGVRTIVKRTGPIKGVGIIGDPVTELQEAFLQENVDAHFAYFRESVVNGRQMSDEEFDAVSDGRWWLGAQAVENKIIDRVSTLQETLAMVRKQILAA